MRRDGIDTDRLKKVRNSTKGPKSVHETILVGREVIGYESSGTNSAQEGYGKLNSRVGRDPVATTE